MIKSKIQNPKSKIRRLLVCLLIATIVLFLFFYRPAYYKPQPAVYNRQLSPYLTHYLIPQFYNGVQLQEPFDVVVTQQGINEIAKYMPLPTDSRIVELTSPTVYFVADRIVIAAVANVHGAKLIVTLEVAPAFNDTGLLNINMSKVKIGAVNVTIPARMIGRKMYSERFDGNGTDSNDIRTRLATSFFDGRPFDPVFDIDGKKIRLSKISVTKGSLTLHFDPVSKVAGAAILKY